MSELVAKRLVDHLERAGFASCKRVPVVVGGALERRIRGLATQAVGRYSTLKDLLATISKNLGGRALMRFVLSFAFGRHRSTSLPGRCNFSPSKSVSRITIWRYRV